MNFQPTSPGSRDEFGRSIQGRPTPADLLATVSDSEAKKLLQNFIAIRAGITDIAAPKAMELAKNSEMNLGSIFY